MTGDDANRFAASQQGPRPLPLFLDMLRSETAASPERRARALAGLRAFQEAPRPAAPPPLRVHAAAGRARLLHGGGAGRPVVLVPSLINPPRVLDLAPDRSLLRWLGERGFAAFLLEWGAPDPAERALDVAGHVERFLLPLVAACPAPPVLVGYCLGGTMALAAACAAPVAGLALIAAPWRFAGYPAEARAGAARLWDAARPAAETLGLLPMEALQAGFWHMNPAATIAKFERFATLDPASSDARRFVALEDWANDGAALTLAAGRDLFEAFVRDDLPGGGRWRVAGDAVGPARLRCPAVSFVSTPDRIAPAATAPALPDTRALSAGHVGMVIGSRAHATLWEPLARWCAGA